MSAASATAFILCSDAAWGGAALSVHLFYQEHDEVSEGICHLRAVWPSVTMQLISRLVKQRAGFAKILHQLFDIQGRLMHGSRSHYIERQDFAV